MKNETRTNQENFEGARKYVEDNEIALRNKYGSDYIAVIGEVGVIDHDKNQFDLARRMGSRTHLNPEIPVLISNIDGVIHPRVVFMDSPEIIAEEVGGR
jgi:hypothetical protein